MGSPLCSRYGLILIVSWVLILTVNYCYGHSHDHGHNHHPDDHDSHHHHDVNPSFKYSREANEAAATADKKLDPHHDHLHSHSEDSHSHHESHHHSEDSSSASPLHGKEPIKRHISEVWLSALGATLTISFIPFMILWFIPLDNSAEYQPLLKVLLSFASGGLLGDAFLHLIPHALMAQQAREAASEDRGHHHYHGHSHGGGGEHNHSHDMSVGLWVLAGVLAFLVVEKFVRICKGPGHGHVHCPHPPADKKKPESKEEDESKKADSKSTTTSAKPASESSAKVEQIKVAGYLNLAADFAHNLTDGLAIGASFITGPGIGLMTTLTILFHEIPHEIGDFAILVQSGCSRKKAMFLQLLTAFGAVTGTLISLVADGMSETASPWILPFTAGGFIYIACVSVIPELLEETSFKQSIMEILAAAVGVLIMVFIAQYE